MYMFALYSTHLVHFMYTKFVYELCVHTDKHFSGRCRRNPTLGNRVWATFTFFYARLEGLRAEVGFLAANQGFSSIEGTLFGFYDI